MPLVRTGIALRFSDRILRALLAREMSGTRQVIQGLDQLVNARQSLVTPLAADRPGILLIGGPLGQLPRIDTGQQLPDGAAQREG